MRSKSTYHLLDFRKRRTNVTRKYDTCFLKWYSESTSGNNPLNDAVSLTIAEYLRGNTSSNECDELFSKYRTCLNVGPSPIGYLEPLLTNAI